MTLPVLYSFRRCPYAMRARMSLIASDTHCALREIELKNKPDEMLEASPKGTVPVLVPGEGPVLEESLDIMLWALERHDPQGWLAPERGTRDEMLALIRACDGEFKPHLDRYKYPTRHEDVDPLHHRAQGLAFVSRLDDRLGEDPWLFGTRIALADVAIFPFIRQFANTDREWFDEAAPPHARAWLERCLAWPVFTRAMAKVPVWEAGSREPVFPADF